MAQLYLKGFNSKTEHGGTKVRGKRKVKRPFSTKKPLHVILKSSLAKDEFSLLLHQKYIESLLSQLSERWQVRIIEWVNVGNHLHLIVQGRTHEGFKHFLRAFSALVARKVTNARKGKPFGKFWDHLAFSRVLLWGKDLKGALRYVENNRRQASKRLTVLLAVLNERAQRVLVANLAHQVALPMRL